MDNQFFDALRIIQQQHNIVLAPHKNPDGDAVGSVLGFANALYENQGKTALVYSADPVLPQFSFLAGYENIVHSIPFYPNVLIGFDYGDFSRLGVDQNMLVGSTIISFDHHPLRGQVGDVCIIETKVASTTELLYRFMTSVGWHISPATAQCLLTGILTDTGGLMHNIHPNTFSVVADLIQKGASDSLVYDNVLKTKDKHLLNIYGSLMSQVQKNYDYNFVYLAIPYRAFQHYGVSVDELSVMVSMLNKIQEFSFAVLLIEHEPHTIKGSLRGEQMKGVVVSPIAEKLGGGGHLYAAGFSLQTTLEKAQQRIIMAVQEVMQPIPTNEQAVVYSL